MIGFFFFCPGIYCLGGFNFINGQIIILPGIDTFVSGLGLVCTNLQLKKNISLITETKDLGGRSRFQPERPFQITDVCTSRLLSH